MRRDPLEIMEEIFRLLMEEHEALTMNMISRKTGLHNVTVKRYVRLIEMVRDEQELEIIKSGRSIILRIRKVEGFD